ncbi:hypothetical protein PoB_005489600 [Plakobranchus ocellatus]|uniref:Uncharacterized protein n=1 Tax=Plakobranchus ocellatus TaxID=259542 RepID=A0AAV4BZ24_9GAST|nr:hypothetical protein PoB_005489600 [Plakobranchus ocellatus]
MLRPVHSLTNTRNSQISTLAFVGFKLSHLNHSYSAVVKLYTRQLQLLVVLNNNLQQSTRSFSPACFAPLTLTSWLNGVTVKGNNDLTSLRFVDVFDFHTKFKRRMQSITN